MRQLTQIEAERFPRACGWEQKELLLDCPTDYIKNPEPYKVWVMDDGEYYYDNGFKGKAEYKPLPLDPRFWFPRLWERLDILTGPDYGDPEPWQLNSLKVYGKWKVYIGGVGEFYADHPCLALCAAIEALEGKSYHHLTDEQVEQRRKAGGHY